MEVRRIRLIDDQPRKPVVVRESYRKEGAIAVLTGEGKDGKFHDKDTDHTRQPGRSSDVVHVISFLIRPCSISHDMADTRLPNTSEYLPKSVVVAGLLHPTVGTEIIVW